MDIKQIIQYGPPGYYDVPKEVEEAGEKAIRSYIVEGYRQCLIMALKYKMNDFILLNDVQWYHDELEKYEVDNQKSREYKRYNAKELSNG